MYLAHNTENPLCNGRIQKLQRVTNYDSSILLLRLFQAALSKDINDILVNN